MDWMSDLEPALERARGERKNVLVASYPDSPWARRVYPRA